MRQPRRRRVRRSVEASSLVEGGLSARRRRAVAARTRAAIERARAAPARRVLAPRKDAGAAVAGLVAGRPVLLRRRRRRRRPEKGPAPSHCSGARGGSSGCGRRRRRGSFSEGVRTREGLPTFQVLLLVLRAPRGTRLRATTAAAQDGGIARCTTNVRPQRDGATAASPRRRSVVDALRVSRAGSLDGVSINASTRTTTLPFSQTD
mmetsp:Transcript_17921/g.55886  ORF Transcript_17921/g.55886 Transcript_17921/m.55886 type:complete len:206 (-) Transcript_17921:2570-3187(-)